MVFFQGKLTHGGYDPTRPIGAQDPFDLIWNRDLWEGNQVATGYHECFIGHTPTWRYKQVPCFTHNVWNLDQGAGYSGCVSMLNVRTKAFVQSLAFTPVYKGASRSLTLFEHVIAHHRFLFLRLHCPRN